MGKLSKFKIIIFIIFLGLFLLAYFTSNKILNAYTNASYEKNLELLKGNYNATINLYTTVADGFYNSLVAQEEILSLLSEAKKSQDPQKQNKLRAQLYQTLHPHFKSLQKKGLKIVLFTFGENDVFLRVHRPSRHSDNISGVRKMVAEAHKERKIIRGFERGKLTHAFRNIYPIFYKDEFIGSVDISFSSESLQKNISDVHGVYTHFLVNKAIFDSVIWNFKTNPHYMQSFEHKNYLYAKTKFHSNDDQERNYAELIAPFREEIEKNMDDGKSFSLCINNKKSSFMLAFEPIFEHNRSRVAAYIISYTQNDEFHIAKESHEYLMIALFTAFLLLAVSFFYIIRQRETLEEQVQLQTSLLSRKKANLEKALKAFDKNVIFSTTNLKGYITHASAAFCQISGYEKEELVKSPHSIVRHKDMPSETFREMWSSLKSEGRWEGEIKNRRKDGSFYWVHTKIEREHDDNNKAIGYYAVREDISAQKEVERLKEELETLNSELENQVQTRTQEIVALNQEIQETQKEVVFTMGAIAEGRSKETGDHVKRVAEYSKLLALYYGVDPEDAEMLKQASPMHDIGKVAIPDAILNKPGSFNEEERKIMDEHARFGYEMLKHSSRPLLKMAATIAHEHHEKWDGSGYPNKLAGENISIYGRITAIADVFDALGSDRVYKKAWSLEKILTLFKEERAKHFDPKLIDILFEHIDEFLEIRDRFKN